MFVVGSIAMMFALFCWVLATIAVLTLMVRIILKAKRKAKRKTVA